MTNGHAAWHSASIPLHTNFGERTVDTATAYFLWIFFLPATFFLPTASTLPNRESHVVDRDHKTQTKILKLH